MSVPCNPELPSAAELLLRAYAKGGDHVDWSDIDQALEAAKEELPGRYEQLAALFEQGEA